MLDKSLSNKPQKPLIMKHSSVLTDNQLVDLFSNGDYSAFGILFERYKNNVKSALLNKGANYSDVDDLIQDTFRKAMEAMRKGDYRNEGKFLGWLTKIAFNLHIDLIRSTKKNNAMSVPMDFESGKVYNLWIEKTREDEIIEGENACEIRMMIDQLPKAQKEVVLLRYYEDMTFKDIVDYIGGNISINTCLGRMRYALINLKKMTKKQREPRKATA